MRASPVRTTPPSIPRKEPLKTWSDWSAGVGYVIDDQKTPGMSYASGLLGLNTELRAAPIFNTCTVGHDNVYCEWVLDGSVTETSIAGAVMIAPASGSTVAATGTDTSNGATAAACTASHTTPTMTNGVVVAVVLSDATANITGVTWDGDAMTEGLNSSAQTHQCHIYWRAQGTGAGKTGNVIASASKSADLFLYVMTLNGAHQTTPIADTDQNVFNSAINADIAQIIIDSSSINGMVVCGLSAHTGTTVTNAVVDPNFTSLTVSTQADLLAGVARRSITVDSDDQYIYFFEQAVTDDPRTTYLYAIRGAGVGGLQEIDKIDLDNDNFGVFNKRPVAYAARDLKTTFWAGQPAKYQGLWYIPLGNDSQPDHMTETVDHEVTANDVGWGTYSLPFEGAGDHLANLGGQLVGVVREGTTKPGEGIGTQAGGVRILIPKGDPRTAADWGPEFEAGEVTDRPLGLITLEGLTFVLQRNGLYSFNKDARSAEVFSDFRGWSNPHRNVPMSIWKGGIVIPHNAGLLYYVPGERPVPMGMESRSNNWPVNPKGVTELGSGIFHSTAVVGDFLYALYQPDLSSTTALVAVAYGNPPHDLTWQVLGTTTLNDAKQEAGIFVATTGKPVSANYTTPSLWFGNNNDLNYVVLGPKASPFRGRSDTHVIGTSGTAYMSELIFSSPVHLDELVVYTEDMVSGDEWQFSIIVNSSGNERNLGAPVRANGRSTVSIDWEHVYRATLGITFTGTDTTARVAPHITSIELFGDSE